VKRVRVMLIDDQILFVESLKTLLATSYPDIEVVGGYYSGDDALGDLERVSPDVVLLDMRMPSTSGTEVCKKLIEARPDIHVMILTTFDNDDYVLDALHSGAEGYLLKDVNPTFLVDAIRSISGGGVLMSPSIAKKVLNRVDDRSMKEASEDDDPFFKLTNREREILLLVGKGMSNKEIAAEACVAEQTVKNYLSSIYSRIGVQDRANAILMIKDRLEHH